MKFIVNTSALLERLQIVIGTVSNKPLLPILDHFLFDIKNGRLQISSTDLETSMSTSMEVESDKDIMIAIPSKMTIDTLRSLPNQPVTFTIDDSTNSIEIKSEFGRYKLNGQPGKDFPKIPEIDSQNSFEISADTLLSSINKTIFATGNDDLRLNLTGVFVQLENDQITFVATDANRMVRCTNTSVKPGVEQNFILPKKALNLLKTTLPHDQTAVRLDYNPSNAFFTFGDIKLICRFIDERYPDYTAVIPDENPNVLTVPRIEFLNAVKRISIFANKSTHQIRLKITGSEMIMSAEDVDTSNEANERLSCEYEGEDIEIGFNSKLLLEMLTNIDCDAIKLEMSTPNRAGIILPTENDVDEDLLMLIMPMMLGSTGV